MCERPFLLHIYVYILKVNNLMLFKCSFFLLWSLAGGSMAADLNSLRLRRWFLTSSLTCFIHVFFGSVRWTFHWAGRFRQRSLNGSLLSVIVQTWSNHCSRHFLICSSIVGWCSHWQQIYSFRRWSQRETRTIWCKHHIWKTLSLARSSLSNIQVFDP